MDRKVLIELSIRRLKLSLGYLSMSDRIIAQERIAQLERELFMLNNSSDNSLKDVPNVYSGVEGETLVSGKEQVFDVPDVDKGVSDLGDGDAGGVVEGKDDVEDEFKNVPRKEMFNFLVFTGVKVPKSLVKASKREILEFIEKEGYLDKFREFVKK